MAIKPNKHINFHDTVYSHYYDNRRDLSWRTPNQDGYFDPYHILVSEIMLQQTQVKRVEQKYKEFLLLFPDVESLASASLEAVLRTWSGLGYNRRAKFLHQAAKVLAAKQDFPQTIDELVALPGIGKNTAAAVLVYSFNMPLVYIETNIRTVYITYFFEDHKQVDDREVLELVAETLDHNNPREWYWALMDYGTHLKITNGNQLQKSKQYKKQAAFNGSARQIRGKIIKQILDSPLKLDQLREMINDERFDDILSKLLHEGLVEKKNEHLEIKS